MNKKIHIALLISCFSVSSYAYIIGTDLIIDNRTDTPMQIEVNRPNNQTLLSQPLPAHQRSIVYVENGDTTELPNKLSKARFKIKNMTDKDKLYVQGRIAFYVGSSIQDKYSYLNSVSAANGLSVDQFYSCTDHGDKIFTQKITIAGTPGEALEETEFFANVPCQGVKHSVLRDNHQYYAAACFDGTSTPTYWKVDEYYNSRSNETFFRYWYGDRKQLLDATVKSQFFDDATLQAALDKKLCGSWEPTY